MNASNEISLRSVRGIDLEIIDGEGCCEDGKLALPSIKVNGHFEGFLLENLTDPFLQSNSGSHDCSLIKKVACGRFIRKDSAG